MHMRIDELSSTTRIDLGVRKMSDLRALKALATALKRCGQFQRSGDPHWPTNRRFMRFAFRHPVSGFSYCPFVQDLTTGPCS
jgi:hypothetical protein